MDSDKSRNHSLQLLEKDDLKLPLLEGSLQATLHRGKTLAMDGTNVIRVPFGIRQPQKQRPQKPERMATLVLPLQPQDNPTPPQAA